MNIRRLLCILSLGLIHWEGRDDGGAMGDAVSCPHCGLDSYSGLIWIINKDYEGPRAVSVEEPECDHIYFPVPDGRGSYIGQECRLCGKFNTAEEVLAQFEEHTK